MDPHAIPSVAGSAALSLSAATLPEAQQALGFVLDLNRSRAMSDWLSRIPSGQLEVAGDLYESRIEKLFDDRFSGGIGNFIHIGRNRLELVSADEAQLFRTERAEESGRAQRSIPTAHRDPALHDVVIIGGSSSYDLSRRIAGRLGTEPAKALFSQFASSETRVVIQESVRGKRVFIIQSILDPVNDSVMELNLTIDALRRASAEEINVIVPLFGYSRQDRKGDERTSVSAELFARFLSAAGADRIITVDVHSAQTEGFFDGPLDNLFASPIIISHLVERYGKDDLIVIGADEGQFKRLIPITPEIEEALGPERGKNLALAAMSKIRTRPGEVDSIRFIGNPADVAGRTAILWDDMGDTLGTILKGGELLHKLGAARIVVVLSHMLGSFNGIDKLRNTFVATPDGGRKRLIDEVICTNTVPLRRGKGDLITVLPVDGLLAEAILRISKRDGDSLRALRKYRGFLESQRAMPTESGRELHCGAFATQYMT